MKNYIYLLMIMLLLASCSTPQQLAQKHLRKAIAYDPNIVKKYTTDTLISGVVEGNVNITTPESKGEFAFDCDSIKKALDAYKANTALPNGGVLIHSDSNVNVSVKKDSAGKYLIKYVVKPKNIYVPVKVPYEVPVKVPGKLIEKEVPQQAWKYCWFWALISIVVLELLLLLKRSKPVLFIQDKLKGN